VDQRAAIDGREIRGAQALVAVLILAGFVFGWPVLVFVAGVLSAIGAFVGPHVNPMHVIYRRAMAQHLDDPRVWEAPSAVRALDVMGTVLCGIAVVTFVLGVAPLGWLFALAEAAIAAVAASTGYNAALLVRDRLRRS
jgi:hypothetical protein